MITDFPHNIKISIAPILFLCYKESLVSSNLNSKQLRFHCVRPNMDTWNHFYFFRIVHTIAKIYPCIAKSLLNKKGTNHHNQNQGETQRYKGEIFLSRQKEAG